MRDRATALWISTIVVFLLATNVVAQKQSPGLAIGEKAPEFALKDQNGKSVSFNEQLKRGSVAVVFHRSADW